MQNTLSALKSLFIKLLPILAVILAFLLLVFLYQLYRHFFGYNIAAEFKELGPTGKSMVVYYKGFRVGRTSRIIPNKDFSGSYVRIILDKNLNKLPSNLIAKVKKMEGAEGKQAGQDYIELLYPDSPAKEFLRRGAIIKGETAVDMQSFMNAQAESGAFTIISDNMGKTLESAEKTSDEMRALVADLRDVLKENKAYINQVSKNLASATEGISTATVNLGKVSEKLNNSITEKEVTEIMHNLTTTTESVNGAAKNIENITGNIDKATKNLDKTMSEFDSAAENLNEITGGTKKTLNKRFGTMRFIFGTPLPNQ